MVNSSAIILAGGKSSRMGQDKAFIKIKGLPLINRQLKLLKKFFKEIIIVTNNPQKYKLRGVKVVRDVIPDNGPLGGIYSGLMASGSFYNFVVACDMPFINPKLIKHIMRFKDGFDVVIPRLKRGYEPLFAMYSKDCLYPISESLSASQFRIKEFLAKIKLKELREKEIARFGKPDILFLNINTPEDLSAFAEDHLYARR